MSRWTETLRTTTAEQTSSRLTEMEDGMDGTVSRTLRHCCIGVACMVSGLAPKFTGVSNVIDRAVLGTEARYGKANVSKYAPVETHKWLGTVALDAEPKWSESDIFIDWPRGGEGYEDREGEGSGAILQPSAADLNDALGFTFKQIADVVDYFGVRPVRLDLPTPIDE